MSTSFSRNSINAIVRRLRDIPKPARPAGNTATPVEDLAFWARITAVTPAGLHSWKRVIFDDSAADRFDDWPVTATGTENAYAIGGSDAAVDDIVWLRLAGRAAGGGPLYVFKGNPAGRALFAKVVAMYNASGSSWTDYPTDSEYPAYCTANPCESDGSDVDTSTTVCIGLNTGNDPPTGIITAANQIIAYMPGDGAKTYGANALSGQAMLGFGCWLDYQRVR